MKFISDKQSFIKAVNYVSNRSFAKTTMNILEGILIEATKDKIKLTTNDLEIGIESYTVGQTITEGKALVHAGTFFEIIKRLPDSDITISLNENNMLEIACEGLNYKLATLETEDFPQIPSINVDSSIEIEQKILKQMIKQTIFAVGTDNKTPLYTGCLFSAENGNLNIVALDGYRLAIKKEKIETTNNFKVVIPGKTLGEVSKNLDESFENVKIGIDNNNVVFEFDNCKVTSNTLNGEFLNYKDIMSTGYITKLLVNKNLLLNSLERISLISSSNQIKEKRQSIFMDITIGKLEISSNSTIGMAKEEIYVETEGQECNFKYNPKYFIEALRNIDDQEIILTFGGTNAPTTIMSTEEESSYNYIILPLRA